MSKQHKHVLRILGGACLLWLATPALAQDQEITVVANMKVPEGFEPVKLVVSIKDLDLATSAGAIKMEKRVGAAIRTFCGPPTRAASWQIKDSKTCSDFAWASARPQMDEARRKAQGS